MIVKTNQNLQRPGARIDRIRFPAGGLLVSGDPHRAIYSKSCLRAYGSLTVLAGFTILCIIVHRLGPKEERDLEARFGNQYREYKSRVPRWLWIRSRAVEK